LILGRFCMKQFSVARVVIKIQRGCSVGGFVQLGG